MRRSPLPPAIPAAVLTVLVLGTAVTGCVSLPTPDQRAGKASQPPSPSPSPSPSWRTPTQATAREALLSTAPREPRPTPPPARRAAPPPAWTPPPRPAARPAPPPAPTPPRRTPPRQQPRTGHDSTMRELCRASDGMTDPSVTALCRAAFGR